VRNPSKNKFKGFPIIFEKTGNASKNFISRGEVSVFFRFRIKAFEAGSD